ALLGILCLALVPLTLNRLHTFSSPLLLWDDAEKLVRGKPDAIGVERIYYNRGTELGKLQRYEAALADFNKAIAIHPFDDLYGNRATAYYFLGRYREALGDYDLAIELNQTNPNAYQGRALAYRALGDFSAAEKDFQRSCALGLCQQE
ncbi:MAG: tetratricopeptide repeat protein, partial [Nitrosomonadales bacterium]|nr:tetratricopeptide repeat protein [Nitrosomonadales bacterium]